MNVKICDIYNHNYFDCMMNEYDDDIDVLRRIAFDLLKEDEYRIDGWAYAGEVLWCRDYYGSFYKIPELVKLVCNKYIPYFWSDETIIDGISKLYLSLLLIHPFFDGNGRSIYCFVSFLAYKYSNIYPCIYLLENTDRLHLYFRTAEHKAYGKLRRICSDNNDRGLRYDKRLRILSEDIGYYNYSSTKHILLDIIDESSFDDLKNYFIDSLGSNKKGQIFYMGEED